MAETRPELRRDRGFTLIEVLIVVAIIASIAAIAVPIYSRVTEKSQRAAFAAEAKIVFEAFKQYYVDQRTFPSEGLFDKSTLDPLTSNGYVTEAAARSFLGRLRQGRVQFYWALDWDGPDSDLVVVMRPNYDDNEWAYLLYSQLFPQASDGVYFWHDGKLVPVDKVVP